MIDSGQIRLRLHACEPRPLPEGWWNEEEQVFALQDEDTLGDSFAMLISVCHTLQEAAALRFEIHAFATEPWYADIPCELCIALEHAVDLGRWWRGGAEAEFELDFYEQGTERSLFFRRDGDTLEVHCVSRTSHWTPEPGLVTLPVAWLPETFRPLLRTFLVQAERVCPVLTAAPGFQSWKAEVSALWELSPE